MIILDGHNDTLLRLHTAARGDGTKGHSFFEENERGHIDLPRARRGGFGGGFFAIFTPNGGQFVPRQRLETETGFEEPLAPAVDHRFALEFTLAVAAGMFRLEAASGGQVRVVRTTDELAAYLDGGPLAMIFHIEGAEAIDEGLDTLHVLYAAGLRSVGLVWSRPNAFGHGVPFRYPSSPDTGPGLTDAGHRLVSACNELGIVVDLSHLNEAGFWDVARCSTAPLVATHSAANTLCPTARNLTDEQLDAIGASGGVVGVNFHVGDLRSDGRRDPDTPIGEIVRHIDYIVERIGIDHVAFGSDFDGATISNELRDVAGLPRLVDALAQHGFDQAALKKLAHENWLRVLNVTWK